MAVIRSRVLWFFLGLSIVPFAHGVTYSADIRDSRWQNAGSIFECSLTHHIPGFGRAVFSHRAGESLQFYLDPVHNDMRPGKAALVIEQPNWQAGKPVRDLGYVGVSDEGDFPIQIDEPNAENMLASLGKGMAPTFTRRARHSDDPVRVRLNHVNFRDRYQQFQQCAANLLPVNFDQVKRTVVLFGSDDMDLSAQAREELDKVALYVNADDRVEALYVDGHAGLRGDRLENRARSRDRARAVTEYLVAQGVPQEKIATRYHGSRFPVAGDNVPLERHRRATVRLERVGERSRVTVDAQSILTEE